MQKLTIGIYPLFIEFDSKSLRIHDVIYRNDSVKRGSLLTMYAIKLQRLEKRLANLQSKSFLTQYEEHGIELLQKKISDLKTAISVIKVFVQKEPKEEVHVVKTTETFTTTFHQVPKTQVVEPKPQTKFSYVDLCKAIFSGQTDAHKKRSVITAIQEILEDVDDVILKEKFCFKGNGKLKVLYIDNEDWALQKIVEILRKKFRIYWKSKSKIYELVCKKIKISKDVFDYLIQDKKVSQMSFVVQEKQDCVYINKNCVDDIVELYLEKREEYIKKEIESRNVKHRGRKKKIDPYLVNGPVEEDDSPDYIPNAHFLYAGDAVARALDAQSVEPVTEKDYSSSENKMRELTKIIHTLIIRCQDWFGDVYKDKKKERLKDIIMNQINLLDSQSKYIHMYWRIDMKQIVDKFRQGDFMSVAELQNFFAAVFPAPRVQSAKPEYIR